MKTGILIHAPADGGLQIKSDDRQNFRDRGNVRDDLDFDTEVLAKLGPELQNQANFPKFEFLRLVTGTPGRGLAPPAPPNFYPNFAIAIS